MDSLASVNSQKVGSTVSTGNVQHTINGSLEGAAWFFGILDGADLDTLTNTDLKMDDKWMRYLGTYMGCHSAGVPSPSPLAEALILADFYDIPFFPRLMIEVLWQLARLGKFYALSSFTVATELGDLDLAKFAVKKMEGLPSPLLFDKDTAEAMGTGAYWCLVAAYSVAINGNDPHGYRRSYGDHWTGSAAQWRAMAEGLRFE